MALPAGIVPKTVTIGPFTNFDGTVCTGQVTIGAPENVIYTPTNAPLVPSDMVQRLASDGTASFMLCPTDADGLNRKDWAYRLSINIAGAAKQYDVRNFLLPTAGPDTVDLDGLVTVPSSAGTPISVDVLTTIDLTAGLATKADIQRVAPVVTTGGVPIVGKHNPVDATAGPVTLTLPTGLAEGVQVSVEKTDASINAVTISGSLRGVATQSITLPWARETVLLRTDSTGSWWPISGHKTKAALDAAYVPAGGASARRRDLPGGRIMRPGTQQPAVMAAPPAQTQSGATTTARNVTDGAITTGTTTLTSATAAFTAGDQYKRVTVAGAGSGGSTLTATIATVTNATTVTLSTAAGTTVSAASTTVGVKKVWPLAPPVNPSAQAGPAILTGSMIFGRVGSNSNSQSTLSAAVAAGATTIPLANSLPAGTYRIDSPAPAPVDMTPAELLAGENITITAISGSAAPYTATLAAPLANAHRTASTLSTTIVGEGYNTTNYVSGASQINGQSTGIVLEWVTDAPIVEVLAKAPSSNTFRFWVDGQLVTASAVTIAGLNNNAGSYFGLNFGTRKSRRIRFESTSIIPAAIVTDAIDSVSAPQDPSTRVLWIGDSYMDVAPQNDGIAYTASRLLGWDAVMVDQIGGTGYVTTNGAYVAAPARINTQIAAKPDVIVLVLGLNDPAPFTVAQLQTAVTQYLADLKTGIPGVRIYAVGPWALSNSQNTIKAPNAQAIKAACDANGVPYIDTILGLGPGMNPWVVGTGNQGSLKGDGNADIIVSGDGTHPTRSTTVGQAMSGETYHAVRIAEGIAATMAA